MTLSVVFMGTPDFAVPSLSELLANGYDVRRVYTQPPRRSGRGKKLTKSPVHKFAEIMGLMAKGLDTGDILLSETVPIKPDDTTVTLSLSLSQIGATMWPRTLAALDRGGLTPTPQIGEPRYAHKIDKSEARIDWSHPADRLDCHIRGLAPFPGAWCEVNDNYRLW